MNNKRPHFRSTALELFRELRTNRHGNKDALRRRDHSQEGLGTVCQERPKPKLCFLLGMRPSLLPPRCHPHHRRCAPPACLNLMPFQQFPHRSQSAQEGQHYQIQHLVNLFTTLGDKLLAEEEKRASPFQQRQEILH